MGGGARRDPLEPARRPPSSAAVSSSAPELPAIGAVGYLWLQLPARRSRSRTGGDAHDWQVEGSARDVGRLAVLLVASAALAAGSGQGRLLHRQPDPLQGRRDGQLQSLRQWQAGDRPEHLQHPALLQWWRPADPHPLQERHHLEQGHVLEHRQVPHPGRPQEGSGRGQAEDLGQVPQRRQGARHAHDLLRRLPNCSGKSAYSTKA